MKKHQQTQLNIAGIIKNQSLPRLGKVDALCADEQATVRERLHELAGELQNNIQRSLEGEHSTKQ
ncbi:Rop family plasmid primer RNA-binding protein [Salmonella enterica]|uniref:Rop family plasmid primer RNA-binding protein n=1 Tax=Salmonella enterica TaxID=28901 RepID=UPI00094317AE|nr:Rop family plasmid primer RNA-binding protein [Salmonella enterica]